MNNETKRKIVHIAMVGFALFIGRLQPMVISALCLVAFFFNLLLLPKITARALERKADLDRGYPIGILIYPAVLLFLSLIFFKQQLFLAIAWGALAFGDGFAGVIGKAFKGPRIAWNTDKRWSGTLGFILFGSALTLGLIYLLPAHSRSGIPLTHWLLILPLTMIAAGFVETVKGTIDDNFIVPITAGFTAFFLASIQELPHLPESWMLGSALVLLLMVASIVSKKIDVPGALVGMVLAWCIFLGGGITGVVLLLAFFAFGSLASHWKLKEKHHKGLAQENKGTRTVRHAIANSGVAAICGLVGWTFPEYAHLGRIMIAASLASATADTLSSELGNHYGSKFINILTLKPDKQGLDGVISPEGSLFGTIGCVLIALIFFISDRSPLVFLWVSLAGVAGNIIDSVLGASLQRWGWMTNDSVNFANTLFGALFVWTLYAWP